MVDESTRLDQLQRYADRILDVAAASNGRRTDHTVLAANGLSFLLGVLTPLEETLDCLARQAKAMPEIPPDPAWEGTPRTREILCTCRKLLDAAQRIVDDLISGFTEWLIWVWVPALAASGVSSGASIVTATGLTGLMSTRVGTQVVAVTDTVTGLLHKLRDAARIYDAQIDENGQVDLDARVGENGQVDEGGQVDEDARVDDIAVARAADGAQVDIEA